MWYKLILFCSWLKISVLDHMRNPIIVSMTSAIGICNYIYNPTLYSNNYYSFLFHNEMKIIRICETTVSSTVLRNPFIGICTISLGDFVIEKKTTTTHENHYTRVWLQRVCSKSLPFINIKMIFIIKDRYLV